MLFSADGQASRATVFAAAASALVLSTAIAVLLGAAAERYLAFLPLKLFAGAGFVLIGGFLVFEHFARG
jgi:putative Ca2+/H+ antiporter (TMEM165/GDT1 family)